MLSRRAFLASLAAAAPPNILLITADNLGYGDLGCYGNTEIRTPNLNRLAAEGARFTNFYTGSPTCTASRAGLLTGRHPLRFGLNYQLSAKENMSGIGLPHSEKIIPQYLKPLGYTTACFGKWNLGWAPGSRPTERGFDEFLGHRSGNMNYFTHTYNGVHDMYRGIEPHHAKGYSVDIFADAAIDFTRRARKPWFVYLPFNSPHFPNQLDVAPGEKLEWQVTSEALAAHGLTPDEPDQRKRYKAVVTALDTAIGRVIAAVPANTLIFFYSDNGAFMLPGRGLDVQSNTPLRSGGVTCWEGGIRVAAISRWPGVIKPGSINSELLSAFDLLPLFTGKAFDGIDPMPALRGGRSRHDALFFEYSGHQAVRWRNWKLVREKPAAPWQLYDLARDVSESHNLAAANPRVVSQLSVRYDRWRANLR